jgi:hypothetical protein
VSGKLFWSAAFIAAIAASSTVHGEPLTKRAPTPAPLPLLYGRENSLPLCEWGYYEDARSFMGFITGGQGWGDWTCKLPGVPGQDTCGFSGAPDYKPTNAHYLLSVRDQADNYNGNLEWPDGSALYSVWGIQCGGGGAGPRDIVERTNIEGGVGHVLAYVDGGVVEHVRPALVRGTVKIALPPNYLPRLANDLELAIQVYGDNGWEDVETTIGTVEKKVRTFEVSAYVPELSDVRLAVRADSSRGALGAGYDVRDARIFVETCIPDQNDPGSCLGD